MKLLVVWKSNNDIDIHNFIIPYAYNAKVKSWFIQLKYDTKISKSRLIIIFRAFLFFR